MSIYIPVTAVHVGYSTCTFFIRCDSSRVLIKAYRFTACHAGSGWARVELEVKYRLDTTKVLTFCRYSIAIGTAFLYK